MAPPPPPPAPPGPPPPPTFSLPKSSPDSRAALLNSIRQGANLKKAVTNDRSAPTFGGKVNGAGRGGGVGGVRGGVGGAGIGVGGGAGGAKGGGQWSRGGKSPSSDRQTWSNTIHRSNNLGALFADGMPRLRPTGNLPKGQQAQSASLTSLSDSSPKISSLSMKSLNNPPINGITNTGVRRAESKARGPPPQPPPLASQKPLMPTSVSDNRLSVSSHARSQSTVSLPNGAVNAGRGGRAKPQLAPKPPAPAPPPPHKPTRAHSMRIPASPPIIPTSSNGMLGNALGAELRQSFLHGSTDSLMRGARRPAERPPPPPRPPLVPPPMPGLPPAPLAPPNIALPPPPPNSALPPPPTTAAPLPPIRTTSQGRPAPPLPAAPPPPSYHRSPQVPLHLNFESRFVSMFRPVKDFPPPQPFLSIAKVYNSKTAKQPAPAPPAMVQLSSRLWANDSSTC